MADTMTGRERLMTALRGEAVDRAPIWLREGFPIGEPFPPAGDVGYAEARQVAAGKLTLIGNLEWDELSFAEPDHIRQRVCEILSLGNDRLILGASAGPISAITPRVAENYRAWVETALQYG